MSKTIGIALNLKDMFSPGIKKAMESTKQFTNQAKKATSSVSGIGKNVGEGITAPFGKLKGLIAGIGFATLAKESVGLASDLTEVQNVVDTTFGNGADTINKWAKDALNSFGLSELEAKKFNGTLGAMMKSSGITGDALNNMSTDLVGLSGDLGSFYNLKPDEAFDKIRQGISGETEGLKALGINMSVANLEQSEYVKGLGKQWKEMSQSEQTMARYKFLMTATKDAQGDFSKTQGTFANQLKIFKTTLLQTGADIGTIFIPVLTTIISNFNKVTSFIPGIIQGFSELTSRLSTSSSASEFVYLISESLNDVLFNILPRNLATFISDSYDVVFGFFGEIIDNSIRIGKQLIAPFKGAINSIIEFFSNRFSEASTIFNSITSSDNMTKVFDTLKTTIEDVLVTIKNVFDFFNNNWNLIAPIIYGITASIVAYNVAVKGLEVALVAITAVQKIWAAITDICKISMMLLNGELMLTPLGWIILAIGSVIAIGVLLWQNWDWISAKASVLWEIVKNAFLWIGNSIKEAWNSAIDSTVNFFVWIWNSIANFLIGIWNSVANFFTWVINGISNFFAWAISSIPAFITAIIIWLKQLPSKIIYGLGFIIGKLISWGAELLTWVFTTIPAFVSYIVSWIAQLPGRILTWLVATYTGFVNWCSDLVAWASTSISEFVTGIVNYIAELPVRIWEWLVATYTSFINWGSDLISWAGSTISEFVTTVVDWIAQLPSRIWEWLVQVVTEIGEWGVNLITKGIEAAIGLKDAIVDEVCKIPGKMIDIGKNIVEGLWNGITGMGSWLSDKASGFFNDFTNGIKDGLGIHSPSRLFADEVGKFIPMGIELGFSTEFPNTVNNMRNKTNTLVDEVGISKSATRIERSTTKEKTSSNIYISNQFTIQGNMIGNKEYMDETAQYISDTIKMNLNNM